MIYFVETDGIVKIGFSKDPNTRLKDLETSMPHELNMILLIEGTMEDESAYHKRFEKDHIKGEWFALSYDITEFIQQMQDKDLRYDYGLLYNTKEMFCETTRIRNVFHYPLRVVGEMLGITAQSVKETEDREKNGTVSLNVLRKYAEALGYRLVYKFVKGAEEIEGFD
jgi:hypothetical protein